jgi:hypothetical protein
MLITKLRKHYQDDGESTKEVTLFEQRKEQDINASFFL